MNFFKNYFNKEVFSDYIFVAYNLKKNNFFYFLFFLFITPISFLFFMIFIFFTLFFLIYYNIVYFYQKFFCFFLKWHKANFFIFKFNKKVYKNNFILFMLIFLNISKKSAFKIIYNFHLFYNKNKENLIRTKIIIYLFFNLLVRILFIFLFYFNIKVFSISIRFLNCIKPRKNKNLKNYIESTFLNFLQIYDSDLTSFVKNHKIIFDSISKSIIFNPNNQVKILKNLLNDKFKLSDENLSIILKCINIIKDESVLEYNMLVQEVDKNYPGAFEINNNSYIGENIPHVFLIVPVSNNDSFLIRETKSSSVNIKSINQNFENFYMQTGYKSQGSLDKKLTVFKTPIINVNNNCIYQQNNNKLLNNVLQGLTNKNDFIGQFISSIYKPVYVFDKGNIYKDLKYINFHDKLINDPNYSLNRTESMETLKELVNIWNNHFSLFKDLPNAEIVENIIKFCILQQDFVIQPEILQQIFDL